MSANSASISGCVSSNVTPPKSSGAEPSHAAIRTGFRKVEVRQRDLLINGKRVLIKGVNRHDHHPDHAKALPFETMLRDVVLMKRFNFNAVRCSHYPNDPRFLDLELTSPDREEGTLDLDGEAAPDETGHEEVRTGGPVGGGDEFSDVGRNSLCPCGSGKKYKRCHGAPGGPSGHTTRVNG